MNGLKSRVSPASQKIASMSAHKRSRGNDIPVEIGELWTARQRQMHPLHYVISYRASFKPELPDFFIRKYLAGTKSATVLDPFGGRGTTAAQANLLGYGAIHNDLNPVSIFIAGARQRIPTLETLRHRLDSLHLDGERKIAERDGERLLPFFHPETLAEILSLRDALMANPDDAMKYIGLTALSRLHGHSDGFFSVYSFPQISIMPGAQRRNNLRRGVEPEYKEIKERVRRKMERDLSREIPLQYYNASAHNRYLRCDARDLHPLSNESIDLIVTSPPFLDKVNYLGDNWMRAWFLGVEEEVSGISLTVTPDPEEWLAFMTRVMIEMGRLLRKGGRAVIEVGEVASGGRILNLEEHLAQMLPLKVKGGRLIGEKIYINSQRFTKLANCWDVKNNEKGTNSNRCLVILKE